MSLLINRKRRDSDQPMSCILNFAFFWMSFVLITRIEICQGDWLLDCGNCNCKWNLGKKTADCSNMSLAAVPENLNGEVQVLDLSRNRISYLDQNVFVTAKLQNLHKLYIINSSLQKIDPRSFSQLEILIELDLSNNLLRVLQPRQFSRLSKVRAIILNGNLLEALEDGAFQDLRYLHKIELMHNHIKKISVHAFFNLPLLSQIHLNNNQLNAVRRDCFTSLKRLSTLSLENNPWNCTCELQLFRDFVLSHNLYAAPTACYFPPRLRGMLWMEDQPEAFACKPQILYPVSDISINTSKDNVTLTCRVYASPNTAVFWDYNKQTRAMDKKNRIQIELERDEKQTQKEFGRVIFISRLSITNVEKLDEGVYTCIAENAGGKETSKMHLHVQHPVPQNLILQYNLSLVVFLIAMGLLGTSTFLAVITCFIFKRFKSTRPWHQQCFHNLYSGRKNIHPEANNNNGNNMLPIAIDTSVFPHYIYCNVYPYEGSTKVDAYTQVEPSLEVAQIRADAANIYDNIGNGNYDVVDRTMEDINKKELQTKCPHTYANIPMANGLPFEDYNSHTHSVLSIQSNTKAEEINCQQKQQKGVARSKIRTNFNSSVQKFLESRVFSNGTANPQAIEKSTRREKLGIPVIPSSSLPRTSCQGESGVQEGTILQRQSKSLVVTQKGKATSKA